MFSNLHFKFVSHQNKKQWTFPSVVVLQVGDILTQVESVDEQWIMGVVGEKRGIVPKNYISLLWGVSQQEIDSVNRSVNTCHTCQLVLQRFFPPKTFQVFVVMCIQQPALFLLAAELEELWGVIGRLMESNLCHAGDFCRPVGFSFLHVSRLDWILLFSFPSWSSVSALDLMMENVGRTCLRNVLSSVSCQFWPGKPELSRFREDDWVKTHICL